MRKWAGLRDVPSLREVGWLVRLRASQVQQLKLYRTLISSVHRDYTCVSSWQESESETSQNELHVGTLMKG